jgi:hypothetical protein
MVGNPHGRYMGRKQKPEKEESGKGREKHKSDKRLGLFFFFPDSPRNGQIRSRKVCYMYQTLK